MNHKNDRSIERDQDLTEFLIKHSEKYPEFYPNAFAFEQDMFMMDKLIRDKIYLIQELFMYEPIQKMQDHPIDDDINELNYEIDKVKNTNAKA